jgi:hypothetical protein
MILKISTDAVFLFLPFQGAQSAAEDMQARIYVIGSGSELELLANANSSQPNSYGLCS